MFTVKDKYVLWSIMFIWSYLIMCNINRELCNGLHIPIIGLTYITWFFIFNKNLFYMTEDKLRTRYYECKLKYKAYIKDDLVTNIYVKFADSDDWYELYYPYTISKYCNVGMYKAFTSKYNTVGRLLNLMNDNKNYTYEGKLEYEFEKKYKLFKIISFIIITFTIILIYCIKEDPNYYYYG